MKNFARALFPFLLLDLLTFGVFPFLPVFTLVPVLAHTVHANRTAMGGRSGRIIKTGVFSYYFMLALLLYVLFRIIFAYFTAVLAVVTVAVVVAVYLKRISPLIAAGIILNLLIVILLFMVVPPKITPRLVDRIKSEKYVKPIHMYMGTLENYAPDAAKYYNGVRSVTSNKDETRFYFTAKGAGKEGEFFSLFSIDPEKPDDVKKWSDSRIFDVALTPDEEHLLATDYDNARLHMLDAETLAPVKSVDTFPHPMFVLVDKYFERAFVMHETGGLFIQYSLPDLEEKSKKITWSAPVAWDIDWKSGEMYSANWLFPFLLSEVDMFRASLMRIKFPFSFTGSGVSLDNTRYRVYVANAISGRIFAVDRETFKTVGKIKNLPTVRPILVDEERKLIYAGNMLSPYVYIYDFDHREVGKVYAGSDCRTLYLTPSTRRLLAGTIFGLMEIDVDSLLNDMNNGAQ